MLIRNRAAEPIVDASAFVAPTAVLVGRVSVGPRARIMYGTVLDSEASKVEVGATAIVCENAVLRATSVGDADLPVVVGDHAFVGPHATCWAALWNQPATWLPGLRSYKGPR